MRRFAQPLHKRVRFPERRGICQPLHPYLRDMFLGHAPPLLNASTRIRRIQVSSIDGAKPFGKTECANVTCSAFSVLAQRM
jgi:hypothetical protein